MFVAPEMANSTFGTFTCIGSKSMTEGFFSLNDPSSYFDQRLYDWRPTEDPAKEGSRFRCKVEFEFRLLMPVSVFRVLEDFPRCEWRIAAHLEFALADWYSLAELGEYEAIANHPKFTQITGGEIGSCITKFNKKTISHKVRIGERLNLVVEQKYHAYAVLAGAEIPMLFYREPEGWSSAGSASAVKLWSPGV